MRLLVQIDQKAAIAAGIDAPHSTARVEFNPQAVRDPGVLRIVSENINLRTGEVDLPADLRPKFLRPPTTTEEIEAKFTEAMWAWADRTDAPEWLQHRMWHARDETMQVLEEEITRRLPGSTAIAERGADGKIVLSVDRSARLDIDPNALQACETFEEFEPAWPSDPYPPIVNSAEAERWRVKLAAENEEAARDACETAALRLEGKEAMLAELRERQRREEEAEKQREEARFTRYSAWVREHGTALARERLSRGWLSADDIFPMILQRQLAGVGREFLARNDPRPSRRSWQEVKPRDDAEMAEVLDLERALAAAGMTDVRVHPAIEMLVLWLGALAPGAANEAQWIPSPEPIRSMSSPTSELRVIHPPRRLLPPKGSAAALDWNMSNAEMAEQFGYTPPDKLEMIVGDLIDRAVHRGGSDVFLDSSPAGTLRARIRVDGQWHSEAVRCTPEEGTAILEQLKEKILGGSERADDADGVTVHEGSIPWLCRIGNHLVSCIYRALLTQKANGLSVQIRLPSEAAFADIAEKAPTRRGMLAIFQWPEHLDEGEIEIAFGPAVAPKGKPSRRRRATATA